MSLPLTTETLRVQRRALTGDPYDAMPAATTVATVSGAIVSPGGRESIVGGAREVTDARALLPPGTDVTHLDWLVSETTGLTWSVVWTSPRVGLGLDHIVCGVNRVQGQAAG